MTSMYDDLGRPPLNAAALRRSLTGDSSRWTAVQVVATAASTNAELTRRARRGEPAGSVLIAEHQVAGRGRLGREWVAAPRAGLSMSVLIRPVGVPVARWPWIPLLSGLAVAAALRQVADVPAMLKWPNDVMVDDKKLAGLLVERIEGDSRGPSGGDGDGGMGDGGGSAHQGEGAAAVIGIGLNVTTTRAELPTAYATSLLLEGASTTDRQTLASAVLRRLDGLLSEWEAGAGEPSAALLAAYRAACSTLGAEVRVELPGREPVEGRAVDIDDSGRLLVQSAAGRQALGAGDVVRVRRTP